MSAQLPLIVRDIPVYNKWLQDGVNCFKAKNNTGFIEKLRKVVNGEVENLDEIVKNAYELAKERDLIEIGKKYKEYYEYVLENFGK